jgi:hypothetical protein
MGVSRRTFLKGIVDLKIVKKQKRRYFLGGQPNYSVLCGNPHVYTLGKVGIC